MAAMSDKQKLDWILSCREEADEAKSSRMSRNDDNFDMFHLKHNFEHKDEGQSTEILSKQSMAVEQIKSFFQQALADVGDWWKAECRYPIDDRTLPVRPHEITKLTNYKLEQANYFSHVGNSVQMALLGSLAVSKIYAKAYPKPKYVSRKKGRGKQMKRWLEVVEDNTIKLCFEDVRHRNFYPDPTGKGLYIIEDSWLDYSDVMRMAEGDEAIYSKEQVMKLSRTGTDNSEESFDRARENGQNTATSGHRPKVKITEFWGSIINPNTGEMENENCVCTIANDSVFIRTPESNPLWHQSAPYVFSPLYEVANSVWHRAPMDAPTQHNRALIELYNLMVDAAMRQVHSVNQLRKDVLDNPAQVSNGIKPGQTLVVNSGLPVGGKVLEPLTQVQVPNEAFNILNLMNQEFNASALTNDLRQGVMPFRAVKATEVVEASQTITSVFQGIAKNFECRQILPELELAWKTIAQNWDKIPKEEFEVLFGKERAEELYQLSPQDVFAATVNGTKFRVYGISLTLSKGQDFKKMTTLLQTISASPVLMEEFLKKYDLGKTLGEIMTALDIDKYKLEIPIAEQMTMQEPGPEQGAPVEPGADQMSQVPQAGGLADLMGGGGIPQTEFPGSPATAGQGGY